MSDDNHQNPLLVNSAYVIGTGGTPEYVDGDKNEPSLEKYADKAVRKAKIPSLFSVCSNPATKTFSRCSMVKYYGEEHQRLQWSAHKKGCKSYRIHDLSNNPAWLYNFFGYCLDCTSGLQTWYCDVCKHTFICSVCEGTHSICRICRGDRG